MNTYIVESLTNYELMVHVVNAESEDEAIRLAMEAKKMGGGAWPGCKAHLIDTTMPGATLWLPKQE